MKTFSGKTEDRDTPILKSAFWTVGKKLTGSVVRIFNTRPEPGKEVVAYELHLSEPLKVDAGLISQSDKSASGTLTLKYIAISETAGISMALQAAFDGAPVEESKLQVKDIVTIEHTADTDTGKESKRKDFTVTVKRP